ncbi:MAG: hypothetical protein KBF56_00205 [Gemmatimonadaceae bacterium]|nr:hypothetical protein [Gemmatimonadaceae bacterium]
MPDVRELRDGRVLVVDAKDREVSLMSANGVRIRKVGRTGAGPLEYRWPIRILPLPGDSSLVVDRELRRVLLIAPDATPLGVVSPPPGVGQIDYDVIGDAQGGVVFPAAWHGTDADPFVLIIRWDRRAGRVDTVGKMQMRAIVTTGDPKRGITERGIYYSPNDVLLPRPAGGFFLLRGKDYHLEVIQPGRAVQSFPAVPYKPVELSAAEKREESANGTLVPAHKPAFNEAIASPDGEIWVRRMVVDGSTQNRYDVLDAKGVLLRTVVLPRARRVVALSATRVYIARVDDDGLNWLEAHLR